MYNMEKLMRDQMFLPLSLIICQFTWIFNVNTYIKLELLSNFFGIVCSSNTETTCVGILSTRNKWIFCWKHWEPCVRSTVSSTNINIKANITKCFLLNANWLWWTLLRQRHSGYNVILMVIVHLKVIISYFSFIFCV